MDQLQECLARIGLELAARYGFVLGGGHAVQLHGFGARPSEDIDLFTPWRGTPEQVEQLVVDAYRREGFQVDVRLRTPDLVQMEVSDAAGHSCKVDPGVFWQARSPVMLEIGPVLHPDDAVAGKMDALFNRWAPRDFLDIDAILSSGCYTTEQLLAVAEEHNPGFDRPMFAEAISYLDRVPDRDFLTYGVTSERIETMRKRFNEWQRGLSA
ncbi:nucleotidyl transferase AbiEii/AbiGii toxin family protein [Sphaerimonospora cavernae]|uniref:Nucleotidyl transferase AbiEii/AbiGii toxin family protein n=1 Tax=Sphaerimonospora cavernae TaxID=1740611 RepID=A0ABV6TZB3_9ACTN